MSFKTENLTVYFLVIYNLWETWWEIKKSLFFKLLLASKFSQFIILKNNKINRKNNTLYHFKKAKLKNIFWYFYVEKVFHSCGKLF